MRKTQKKFLGLLGLSAVAIMTMVAANMPSQGVSAVSTVTDTIEVRVIGTTPAVDLTSPADGKEVSFPEFTLNIRYENAVKIIVRQTYIDDGSEKIIAVYNTPDNKVGEIKDVKFAVDKYGEYKISAEAIDDDGAPSPEDYVVFKYLPILASYSVDPITGEYSVKVDSVGYDVYTADFYLDDDFITTQNRTQLENSEEVPLKLKEKGTYHITIVAKNAEGDTLYVPLVITINYTPSQVPDAGAPDTGGMFQNLNISSEDYLTTGLIMFFILGIVALGIVISGRKVNKGKRH
ncbi:hypothetical protein J6X73_01265 [Candidatus Saccharibacteria bacterium]|nr:hypothetical protein [Candidatus Saccharibacteria bacterium]